MIRLTELKLPLDHAADALLLLIAQTLGISISDAIRHTVFKHSFDLILRTFRKCFERLLDRSFDKQSHLKQFLFERL